MNADPAVVLQIVAVALVAGYIQGLSGFAFGLIASSLWAWTIEPQLVVPTVVFGSFLGQAISIRSVRHEIRWQRVWPLLAGGLVGVPLGAALLPALDVTVFRLAVGTVLVTYCSLLLLGTRLPVLQRAGWLGDLAAGFGSGVMGGASALSGPPMTLWCAMRGWGKDVQRASYQTFFMVTHLFTIALYVSSGVIDRHSVQLFGWVAPPILVSAWLGARGYQRLSGPRFMRVLFLLLLASGLSLVGVSLWQLVRGGAAP